MFCAVALRFSMLVLTNPTNMNLKLVAIKELSMTLFFLLSDPGLPPPFGLSPCVIHMALCDMARDLLLLHLYKLMMR